MLNRTKMINMLKSSSKLKPPVQIGLAGFTDFGPLACTDSSQIFFVPDHNLHEHNFLKFGGQALTGKVFLKQLNLK